MSIRIQFPSIDLSRLSVWNSDSNVQIFFRISGPFAIFIVSVMASCAAVSCRVVPFRWDRTAPLYIKFYFPSDQYNFFQFQFRRTSSGGLWPESQVRIALPVPQGI